ncbi:MAG TPA: helix-turn-helix transcriptional regulator [Rhizobium sp.]
MSPLFSLLRSARFLLGKDQAVVGIEVGMKAKTVHLIEAGKYKLLPREALVLKAHYQALGVEFTEAGKGYSLGIRWALPGVMMEDRTLDHFGSRILRAARGLADLSQRELAAAAGVDPSFIARFENNKYGAINEALLSRLEVGLRSSNVEMTKETSLVGAGVRWIDGDMAGVDR